MANLTYHYQLVVHNAKDAVYLHEAFSTRLGDLYMVNPMPVEVVGETEEEIEVALKAMESDSVKYRPVHINSIIPQLERWTDEVDVHHEFVPPSYVDEADITDEDDYLDNKGEVIDLVDYFKKRR